MTITIYRRVRPDGRTLYEVADYSSGRRQLRSFGSEEQAVAEAERAAKFISRGEDFAANFRAEDRASLGRARELLRETGISLELAAARFAEAWRILGGDLVVDAARAYAESHRNVTNTPVQAAVNEHIRTKSDHDASRRYVNDLRHRLGRFAADFRCGTAEVTTPALQTWLDGLKLSAQSMRNFRTVLTGFFTFCRSKGWVASNPAEGLTIPRIKGDAEPEIFTADEFSRLLHAADPDFLPALVLGGLCGLRTSEVERIHWEDINLAAGEVIIRRGTAKTRSRRLVPLCDAARAWLAPYRDRSGPVWVGKKDMLYRAQEATAAATEVRDASGSVITPSVSWRQNGLRHGYASHRLAVTGDAVRVAHEMGNSPAVVHAHYASIQSPASGHAWFAIGPTTPRNVTAFTSNTNGPSEALSPPTDGRFHKQATAAEAVLAEGTTLCPPPPASTRRRQSR